MKRDILMKKLETRFSDELSVSWLYSFSVDNILFNDPTSLLYEVIDKKFFKLDNLFLK